MATWRGQLVVRPGLKGRLGDQCTDAGIVERLAPHGHLLLEHAEALARGTEAPLQVSSRLR